MAFQQFKMMSRSFRAKISVRANGTIGFSRGSVNKYAIGDYQYCELYYDSDEKLAGFRFVNEDKGDETAKLCKRGQDTFISARPFLNFYQIDFSRTRAYSPSLDEESGLIVINLGEPLYESKRKKE